MVSRVVGIALGLLGVVGVAVARAHRKREQAKADAPRSTEKSAPESSAFFTYEVRPGETLSGIARKFLGDAQKWPALCNGFHKEPEDLRAGDLLWVPCRWVVAKPGDTLAKIAERELNDVGAWRRILMANPDMLKVEAGRRVAVPVVMEASALDMLGAV